MPNTILGWSHRENISMKQGNQTGPEFVQLHATRVNWPGMFGVGSSVFWKRVMGRLGRRGESMSQFRLMQVNPG